MNPRTFWDGLSGSTKATIEAVTATVVLPVGDVLVQELQTGSLDGHQLLSALEVGVAAGLLYAVAYLRGLVMLPSGQPIVASKPVIGPTTTATPVNLTPVAPAAVATPEGTQPHG